MANIKESFLPLWGTISFPTNIPEKKNNNLEGFQNTKMSPQNEEKCVCFSYNLGSCANLPWSQDDIDETNNTYKITNEPSRVWIGKESDNCNTIPENLKKELSSAPPPPPATKQKKRKNENENEYDKVLNELNKLQDNDIDLRTNADDKISNLYNKLRGEFDIRISNNTFDDIFNNDFNSQMDKLDQINLGEVYDTIDYFRNLNDYSISALNKLKDKIAKIYKDIDRKIAEVDSFEFATLSSSKTLSKRKSKVSKAPPTKIIPMIAVTPPLPPPTAVRATPANAAPAKEPPAKAAPAKAAPAKETPTKAVPAKAAPAKEAPAKEPPAKAAPAKEPPAKEPPAKEPPAKAAPAKAAPAKEAPAKAASAKEAPAKAAPAKEPPAKEPPAKAPPAKAPPAKEAPAKAPPAKAPPAKASPKQ